MNYLNILPSTIITDGKKRSCLIDVEKGLYCVVPNSLTNLFSENKTINIQNFLEKLDSEARDIFEEYKSFLVENGFAVLSSSKQNFIELNLYKNEVPYTAHNIIIDFKEGDNYKDTLNSILSIHFKIVQLRLYFSPTVLVLKDILNHLYNNDINNVEIIFNHNLALVDNDYKAVFNEYSILTRLVVMGYHQNTWILKGKVLGTKQSLNNSLQCGIISSSVFNTHLNSILLSNNHNSCLHKKISIDVNGDIKNCPSMPESYGNIKDTTLEEAINKPGFKKYWNITKDDIEVCRDCEFRYICTDCRAYTERTKFSDEGLDLSKPLKCGYNPYTNEWSEWSTNPLKEKAIEYYGMKEIIDNDKK